MPEHAEVGDRVVLFGDGRQLYVLRPEKDGEGGGKGYMYVGDAYMSGYMDGEAIEKEGWEGGIEVFEVR